MTETTPTVHQAWSMVMGDVKAVGKDGWNPDQKFKFRGIDAVMNAVGPILRKHNVIVIPEAGELLTERYTTGRGTAMKNATVHMRYTVIGPAGDTFAGSAWGEAADSSDKSVSKAESVAYRTFLLQGLTLPTDESDPDASSHERVAFSQDAQVARDELAEFCEQVGISLATAMTDYAKANGGQDIRDATDPGPIRTLAARYRRESKNSPAAEDGSLNLDINQPTPDEEPHP